MSRALSSASWQCGTGGGAGNSCNSYKIISCSEGFLFLYFNLIIIDSLSAETDVDEGQDWDIFNINEGLKALIVLVLFCCVMCLCLWEDFHQLTQFSFAAAGLDLLEGDIEQDQVSECVQTPKTRLILYTHKLYLVVVECSKYSIKNIDTNIFPYLSYIKGRQYKQHW